jgi:hypothetical protein
MRPFTIRKQNHSVEIVAKITDSLVQEYGCRVRYNRGDGCLELEGEDYCRDVVREVVKQMIDA